MSDALARRITLALLRLRREAWAVATEAVADEVERIEEAVDSLAWWLAAPWSSLADFPRDAASIVIPALDRLVSGEFAALAEIVGAREAAAALRQIAATAPVEA